MRWRGSWRVRTRTQAMVAVLRCSPKESRGGGVKKLSVGCGNRRGSDARACAELDRGMLRKRDPGVLVVPRLLMQIAVCKGDEG